MHQHIPVRRVGRFDFRLLGQVLSLLVTVPGEDAVYPGVNVLGDDATRRTARQKYGRRDLDHDLVNGLHRPGQKVRVTNCGLHHVIHMPRRDPVDK